MNGDSMIGPADRWDKVIVLSFEIHIDFDIARHMATRAIIAHCGRQSGPLVTIVIVMALPAGLDSAGHRGFKPVRIVAGRARQLVTGLKTPTLPQILDLIRNVIVFRVPGTGDSSVMSVQGLARSIGKRRSPMSNRIAVALRAHFKLSFP